MDYPSCNCHSRRAGMYCINHWIPAFAGMTDLVVYCRAFWFSTCSSASTPSSCLPRRHSSESWNPGERRRGVNGPPVLQEGALSCRLCDCHSRQTGMYYINHWIPRRPVPDAALPPTSCRRAFAGMTTGCCSSFTSFQPACRKQAPSRTK